MHPRIPLAFLAAILVALRWTLSSSSSSFLNWGAQNWTHWTDTSILLPKTRKSRQRPWQSSWKTQGPEWSTLNKMPAEPLISRNTFYTTWAPDLLGSHYILCIWLLPPLRQALPTAETVLLLHRLIKVKGKRETKGEKFWLPDPVLQPSELTQSIFSHSVVSNTAPPAPSELHLHITPYPQSFIKKSHISRTKDFSSS